MLSIAKDKIDSLFEFIGSKQPLYLPVDNNSGKADFAKWQKGTKLSEKLKTTRSAKDFFFPKTEHLVSYEMSGKEVKVVDPRKDVEDFVIFGVRACDARGFTAIDNVYLNMNPVDSYYKNRREHGTVIVLACNEPAKTCFCSTFGIDASLAKPAGDVSCWLADGKYYFEANTDKGKAFVENAKSALEDADTSAVEACRKDIAEKVEKLPFAHLDLSKFQGKDMLKIFNSKIWDKVSEPCVGCGTCTYVCPTCMCFDVRDFATSNGVRQIRCWDSCMYNDFTQMAAENPRHTQKERSRQRFMHKLMYYPMAHDGMFSCVGCGRCVENCPVNMNIVKVIKTVNESDDI
ncbi:MAG: 4Fe-4S dicluster domain-containing protein [Treponema succinifaciens]|uniref:4Fe-4S dicluster domain-containing protein n=1 Tax=Treponema succinifaciens TaxID=167 RepID=UPI0023F4C184|nr:4Fe-4S dicluster domain-containing protein [Treponema succinifaciens]MDD6963166.1 4Fe-4S dicluster domain-containing protein [Treponema succinifaciens]MDY5117928.1 4Fe-4S dicluster domain-containing protein [Treponema succinifaciens]